MGACIGGHIDLCLSLFLIDLSLEVNVETFAGWWNVKTSEYTVVTLADMFVKKCSTISVFKCQCKISLFASVDDILSNLEDISCLLYAMFQK